MELHESTATLRRQCSDTGWPYFFLLDCRKQHDRVRNIQQAREEQRKNLAPKRSPPRFTCQPSQPQIPVQSDHVEHGRYSPKAWRGWLEYCGPHPLQSEIPGLSLQWSVRYSTPVPGHEAETATCRPRRRRAIRPWASWWQAMRLPREIKHFKTQPQQQPSSPKQTTLQIQLLLFFTIPGTKKKGANQQWLPDKAVWKHANKVQQTRKSLSLPTPPRNYANSPVGNVPDKTQECMASPEGREDHPHYLRSVP